jgi:hypothetical protein
MSDLARYLAGDNYLTRSASGIRRGLSALADSLTARSNEGIENMGAALSGVRVMPGAILTDAGYVMPDASGQPDFTQVGLEREPDTMRLLELFGSAMTPVKGASVAAKSGAGGKVAADVARALPMDEASRMARADDMRFRPKNLYHGTDADISYIDPDKFDNRALYGPGFYMTDSPAVAGGSSTQYGYAGRTTGSNVVPVMARAESPLYIDHLGGNLSGENRASIANELKKAGVDYDWVKSSYDMPGEDIYRKLESQFGGDRAKVNSILRGSGLDSIVHKGGDIVGKGMGYANHNVTISLDPTAVRSRFAAFDPAKADSADLLASRANLGPIVNALLQGYSER